MKLRPELAAAKSKKREASQSGRPSSMSLSEEGSSVY